MIDMLEVDSVSLAFQQKVLNSVSFTINSGQIIGIVGPSGGGKSSLLKIIAGLLDAQSGNVTWKGKRVKGPSEQLVPGHPDIQLVNQDFALDIYQTVEENVRQRMLYLPNQERDKFTTKILQLVELEAYKNNQAITLSGGEQQRLSIARAIAAEPDVLLLDEPFSHLDVHLKERIGNYLKKLATIRGLTCILVSHEGSDVLQWCEQIHFLNEGIVQRTASPQAFYFEPTNEFEGLFFGEINNVIINGKTTLFRPTEYSLEKSADSITVQFVSATFAGIYWKNRVCTSNGESLILFAQEQLTNIEHVTIKKRKS